MTYIPNITQLRKTNSTTYADLLGLQLGLDRLPGENADDYIKRLEFAANLRREHPYEGELNEISLQLGLEPNKYIHIDLSSNSVVSTSIASIIIDSHQPIPLLTFDADSMWEWRLLSEIVTDLNTIVPATLLVNDGPAFQIARQTNSLWSFSENITGIISNLLHPGVQVGSEKFNQSVPVYTLTPDGLLTFTTEPDSNTLITYNYIVTPYDLVGSPVALIGLKDPEFASVAVTTGNILAYQVREFIQALMRTDRSYWAK